MSLLTLVDQLDSQILSAKRIPLTSQIRVNKEAVYDVLDRIRATLPEELAEARAAGGEIPGADRALTLIDECDDMIHNAKPVPLTDEVRVERENIHDLIEQMRAAVAKEPRAR